MTTMLRSGILVFATACLLPLAQGCKKEMPPEPVAPPPTVEEPAKPEVPPAPALPEKALGLPEMVVPEATPVTAEKVELGKALFFDKRLSANGAASCETCHVHDNGWTDAKQFSTKVDGAVNTRNSPTLYNVGYQIYWYWDGRAPNLENQVLAAWKGHMSGDPDKAAADLAKIDWYAVRFQRAFNGAPTGETISAALAAYVRTLVSGNSAWDRFESGDPKAVSEDVTKGYAVFRDKGKCTLCHVPPLFTDMMFHNVGIGIEKPTKEPADLGRFKVTGDPREMGAFKTPSLRTVSKTGPYFHDGSMATLEEAVKFMVGGGKKNKWLDEKLKPAKLSKEEFAQLLAFVKSLESSEPLERPTLP